jgi:hypothetical protein
VGIARAAWEEAIPTKTQIFMIKHVVAVLACQEAEAVTTMRTLQGFLAPARVAVV